MNWKPRGIFLLALAFTSFAGLAVWRMSEGWMSNAEDQELMSLSREATAASRQAQAYNELFSERLIDLAGREIALRQTDPEAKLPRGEFLQSEFAAISLIKLDREGHNKVDWVLLQSAFQNKWPMEKVKTMLVEMPLDEVRARDSVWYRLPEASQPLFALLVSVTLPSGENAVAAGWLPASNLGGLSDAFKSTGREFFIVDERGYALAFDEQQYVGALLEKDPVVADTMKRRALSWSGKSKNLSGQHIWAATEKVNSSNLFVGVSRAQTWGHHFPFGRTVELILWGLALASLVWWWMERGRDKTAYVPSAPQPEPVAPPVALKPVPEPNHDELFKQFSGRIARSFSGPLSSILGHLQLTRAKLGHNNVEEHLSNIEKEARKVRETLENLSLLSEPEVQAKKKVDLQEAVLLALEEMKGELHVKGIQVVRDLKPTADIMATPESLKFALIEILKVSADAMLGALERKITVTSLQVEQTVKLIVEDTADVHLTTGSSDQIGLGLTAVRGVVQNLGGKVFVETKTQGQGNIVKLEFPAIAVTAVVKPTVTELPDRMLDEDQDYAEDFIFKSPAVLNGKPALSNEQSEDLGLPSILDPVRSAEAPVVFGMELSEESPVQASREQTFVVNIRKPKVRKKH